MGTADGGIRNGPHARNPGGTDGMGELSRACAQPARGPYPISPPILGSNL